MTLVCGKEVQLPEPNRKAILTYVRDFLLNQNKKSIQTEAADEYNKPICLYRSEDKTCACAAGSLIPDANYNSNIENHGLHMDCVRSRIPSKYHEYITFIRELQMIHDDYKVKDWPEKFNMIEATLT